MTAEKRLHELIKSSPRGTSAKLADYLGVPRPYISKWTLQSPRYRIPKEHLPKIAKFFKLPLEYFFDDHMKGVRLVPKIGKASCGVPVDYNYDNADEYIPINYDLHGELYVVEAEGDSMSPKINDKDDVLCDASAEVKSGDIVHYTIDGESGIKKIKITDSGITLIPINAAYEPKFYSKDELQQLGANFVKCVRVISKL